MLSVYFNETLIPDCIKLKYSTEHLSGDDSALQSFIPCMCVA